MLRFKGFNQLSGEDVLSTQDIFGNACRIVWAAGCILLLSWLTCPQAGGPEYPGIFQPDKPYPSPIFCPFLCQLCVNSQRAKGLKWDKNRQS